MPSRPSIGPDAEAELPEYAGHYRLEERLGAGGMGVVHLARSSAGLPLAVKVVHAEFAKDPEFRGRFRQEVAAARRVSGAFTASVVDADPDADRPWMATLYIPGPTLADHVKRNGPLTPAQLRHVTAGLAEALRDIHRVGVVHRDLKPSNVLLAEDSPKVIDFGISRPKDSELRTETGKLIGTPPFMAPEQFRRPREVGPAADVFALGSVLVHAATGRGPFDSDSPYLVAYQVVHDEPDVTGVPEELAPLVLRCLAKEPEDRPTPDELMTEMRAMSARYDTQSFAAQSFAQYGREAFIPAQRRPSEASEPQEVREPWGASEVSGPSAARESSGAPEVSGSLAARESGASEVSGSLAASESSASPRRLRTRIGAAVAGALALGGALALTLTSLPPSDDDLGSRTEQAGAHASFRAWSRQLGSGAAPVCSYGKDALSCTAPGVLAASLDPRNGKVLWLRKASGTVTNDGSAAGSAPAPVLSGGLLQVVAPDGARLLALDPATGETRWSMGVSAYEGQVQPVGDTVLLAAPDGTLTAIDAGTGEQRWRHRLPMTRPVLSYAGGDLAYVTTPAADGVNTQVSAVDPATGAVRWQHRSPGTATPVGVTDDTVWCTQRAADGATVALVGHRLADGAVARRVPLALPLPQATATVHDGKAYLLAAGGGLVAQDLVSGKQLWRSETSVSRGSAPGVDERGRVYVTAPDGRLLAMAPGNGKPLGQTRSRPGDRSDRVVAELATPVVAGERVYGSAPDGTVFGADGARPENW
ncbi:PQQ-binding-like beta-propeller repeat protein [Streptomyces kunmingensis]|uniref:PQQ-binding-like beta-propeller repeat protein n=1 Tax=Streptomyces kunmingensis TaxID=68225 RepID=A0ABU6CBA9_9ACTN|nr:serine/threonine-protein kinase [Streptomyces kunmingensis]MEB3961989.1 PQQ-binding-like beta-propeller repeat protein [Streptomyces kunmingensis]